MNKIEIKNRWTNSILFEYEKENNTVKNTVEEAIKQGADLRGVNLEGANLEEANLRGADLEGAYIYTSDDKINTEDTVKKFKERNNVEITGWYINRNIIPTRWSCFWKYGLIICNYEIAKPILRMTTEEAEKELSKKYECEVKIKD